MTPALMFPADLVGTVSQVHERVRPHLEAFLAGEPWSPTAGPLVDVRDATGWVALAEPPPPFDEQSQLQAYLPLTLLTESVVAGQVDRARENEAVTASLTTPWGLLGLLSPPNQVLVYPPERHRPILSAALRFWDVLDAAGARYSAGTSVGATLWGLTTNLAHVLGRLGVSDAVLGEPLPPEGLWAVVPARFAW
ncbi:hypothetical protein GALL_461050 [mine drainage metagenome]|uniref:Uncharacterized protein n=1 Tax=mine drainage metagenome TaxID=410659 RepID=A0A1J5Q8H9_9ZZZZ